MMANVVHLIGNGFDINAGLKTDACIILDEFSKIADGSFASDEAKELSADIRKKGITVWSDYEQEMGRYSSSPNVANDAIRYAKTKACFDKALNLLLQEREKYVSDEWIEENAGDCLGSLSTFSGVFNSPGECMLAQRITGITFGETDLMHQFLSFNYTSMLDRFLACTKKPSYRKAHDQFQNVNINDLFHVHGSLKNTPVCGVDSASQISNVRFRENNAVVQSVIKKDALKHLGQIECDLGISAMRAASIICVYGMSFGECDQRWWNLIRKLMIENNRIILVVFSHSLRQEYLAPYDYLQDESSIRALVLERLGKMNSLLLDGFASRVFIAPSGNIFPISKPLNYPGASQEVLDQISIRLFK